MLGINNVGVAKIVILPFVGAILGTAVETIV
jgi:hypothetical protein